MFRLKYAAVLITVLALICCISPLNAATKIPKNVLVVASETTISTWDPSVTYDADNMYHFNIYETLLYVNKPGSAETYRPGLAKSWDVSKDGLEWTFQLQKGATFHDGAKFNAAAVKKSFDRSMSLGLGASYLLSPITDIIVIDEYTVKFKLEFAAPLADIISANWGAFIISPKVVDMGEPAAQEWLEAGNDGGSGPYKLAGWKPGEEIKLVKFDEYWRGWNRPEGYLETVIIKIVQDPIVEKQMLDAGAVDIAFSVPLEDFDSVDNAKDTEIIVYDSFMCYSLFMNTERAPLDNKLVRQAIAWAMPYKDIINIGVGGYGIQAKGIIPPGQWSHKKDLFQYQQDLKKAKELMIKAGFPNGIDRALEFVYSAEDAAEEKTAPLIKEALAEIGIDVQIVPINWSQQYAKAAGPEEDRQDLCFVSSWPAMMDPYENISAVLRSEEGFFGFGFAYYKNPKLDELIDTANTLTITDPDKALKLYHEAYDISVEDAPAAWLMHPKRIIPKKIILKGDGLERHPLYNWVDFYYHMWKEM